MEKMLGLLRSGQGARAAAACLVLVLCVGAAPKRAAADPVPAPAAGTTPAPAAAKKPTKAELGAMLKKCSEEADAKGLTPQKGKGEERKAYRRACMLKNGVAPKR